MPRVQEAAAHEGFEGAGGEAGVADDRKLVVLGLPWVTDEASLRKDFSQFGPLQGAARLDELSSSLKWHGVSQGAATDGGVGCEQLCQAWCSRLPELGLLPGHMLS